MKRAIVLQHVPFEGPARLAGLVEARGYELDVRLLYRGDAVPEQLALNEVLIVMGGPMGVGDVDGPEHPFLRQELGLLRWCVEHDAPVLGICLGAQLLAFAAGAPVQAMTREDGARCYEIGWAPIRFHRRGVFDPLLSELPAESMVLHWHGDMFELPLLARRLASTSICPNQAFQLRSRMFGLQFHCEVGEEDVERFLALDADFVERANGVGAVAELRQATARHALASWAVGERLLGNILDAMTHLPAPRMSFLGQ